MFDREFIEKIESKYEQKREKAKSEAAQRKNEVLAKFPELKKLNAEISSFGMRIFDIAMQGGDDIKQKMAQLRSENEKSRAKFTEILVKNGYPENYTDIRYECPLCHDSGYIDSKMCSCMKKEVVMEGYRSSGMGKLIQKQRFDNFDLSVFSDEIKDRKSSDREDMREIYESCKAYADNFSLESPSLLFIGGTGLGKTHLSSAIAGKIIQKGYDVLYDSVPNIISVAEKERFLQIDGSSKMQRYFEADLLIMDDLGTEPNSKVSQSVIYNIINTRALVESKPTIISTNLSYKKLEKDYESPVISRLFGEFDVMLFRGEDFRRLSLI